MFRDVISNQLPKFLFAGAFDADTASAGISTEGFRGGVVNIGVGVGGITFSGSNKVEFKLTRSETDSGYVAADDDDVHIILPDGTRGAVTAGGIVRSLVALHAAPTITRVGLLKPHLWYKLTADFSGTHGAATPMFAELILGNPKRAPV